MKRLFLTLFAVCAMPIVCSAATYYVNSGDSINDAVAKLQPGDTLLVREGVYHEMVTLRVNGTEENRITIKAYEGERVVMDGSVKLTGWVRCDENCEDLKSGGVINPNFSRIFWTEINKEDVVPNPEAMVLFENNEYLYLAQEPNQIGNVDDIIQDVAFMIPITDESFGFHDQIIDSVNFNQADNYWNGARIIYKTSYSNALYYFYVTEFIASEHLIVFSARLPDHDQSRLGDRYSIANHPAVLDTPGEFFRSEETADGKYKIYLWPKDESSLNSGISMSKLGNGFYAVDNANYVTIDGFEVINYSGTGIIVRAWTDNPVKSVIIRNCNVHHNGGGGISLTRQLGSKIINCRTIYNTGEGGRGIHMGGEDLLIANCYSNRNRSTSLSFYGVTNGRMINNVVGDGGVHANCLRSGMTSKNILMAGNKIHSNGRIGFAIKDTENIYLVNNVSYGGSMQSQGGNTGDYVMLNNTIMAGIGNTTTGRCIFKNNIVRGGGQFDADRTHNIYTVLAWYQSHGRGWYFGEGEIGPTDDMGNPRSYNEDSKYELDGSTIFKLWNPSGNPQYDFHLKEDSIAVDSGTDVNGIIKELNLEERFPDYDFYRDIEGNWRASLPSIGAYEYRPGGPPTYDPNNQNPQSDGIQYKTELMVLNNKMKGISAQATIKMAVAESGTTAVKIYDSKGREVITLWDGYQESGEYELSWDGTDASGKKVGSGVYMVHMKRGSYKETKKIVIIR